MYKLFLSFRYFVTRPLNIIPVLCMTLGVMALIVILAVMDGFQAQLRATLKGAYSDLIIRVDYDSDFEEWEKILHGIDGVTGAAPHLASFSIVAQVAGGAPPGQKAPPARMDGALVLGIDADAESAVSEFQKYLQLRLRDIRGKPVERGDLSSSTPDPERPFTVFDPRWATDDDPPLKKKQGVILGRPLAAYLGVGPPRPRSGGRGYVYDKVFLTTIVRSDGSSKFEPRQWTFAVTGIYESGNADIDQHIAYMDRGVAREFFQLARDPQEIWVGLEDYATQAPRVRRELNERGQEIYRKTSKQSPMRPGGFSVYTWEDRQRTFLNAIENEKGLIAIIAGMAFIVTGFMIFSILSMIVTMKTRDIGILKALGAKTTGVLQIFLLNGLLVGLIGASFGLGLGLWFTSRINVVKNFLNEMFGWEPFPQNIYLFSEIPTRVIPGEVAAVVVVALFFALVGAVVPALRAGGMDPVESLRYE